MLDKSNLFFSKTDRIGIKSMKNARPTDIQRRFFLEEEQI